MLEYLLAEKNFAALKQYVKFLQDLPPALQEMTEFSKSFERQGHTMLSPPNIQSLRQAAQTNGACWLAIQQATSLLGSNSARVLHEVFGFIEEFQVIVSNADNRREAINTIDPRQFSLVRSPVWGNAPAANIIDVLREMDRRLEQYRSTVLNFKKQVSSLAESIHSIFVRFIECLTMPICSCDKPVAKIEVYYGLGKMGLPGTTYVPGRAYSQEERVALSKEHVEFLFNLRRRAASAANNLSDFCFRMTWMLDEAQQMLRSHYPTMTMARAKSTLPMLKGPLNDVQGMSDQLVKMTRL
ncbi:hypothetical protein I5P86_27595 [Pseudomonas glycinae]|uniref:hypothetical protein n=1 Tax=Pseudomonas TaxID=286 RepID=UPI0018D65B6E|nr:MULTISPECIES: hypothetical protein [Pseudomonas]MBH3408832.1 hypothetical protein [Pseudomonas glycinae]MDI3400631.1 hypothetical protein [Pseudomonas sp. V88_4]